VDYSVEVQDKIKENLERGCGKRLLDVISCEP